VSIIETLSEATDNAGFKGLSFANLQEFNAFHDSFRFEEYPRNIIIPYNTNGQIIENRKKKVIQLQGWGLVRISEDTNDWRSIKLEEKYIQPMRVMVEKFIVQVVNSDLTDPEVTNIAYTIRPEYMLLNSHLFGVSYTLNWPITGSIC
jgi:hypothetical protein